MSLYGDLPAPKAKDEETRPSGWANPAQKGGFLAPTTLLRGPSNPSGGRGAAGRGMAGRGIAAMRPQPSTNSSEVVHVHENEPKQPAPRAQPAEAGPSLFSTVPDEYDPLTPNDYMEILRERESQLRKAVEEADKAIKMREVQRKMREHEKRAEHEERTAGLASTSTSIHIDPAAPPSLSNVLKGHSGGLSAAQRMLEKMGWKAGVGLGRRNQGIVNPLIASRVNGKTAVVTTGDPEDHIGLGGSAGNALYVKDEEAQPPSASLREAPSCVLLLTNMVGPGEVDEQLEEETAQECEKYGPVRRVTIYEMTSVDYPKDEAVRIFVEFKDSASCGAAHRDLDGRFFAGRQVRARFFDEGRFRAEDLAPGADERGIPGDASGAMEVDP